MLSSHPLDAPSFSPRTGALVDLVAVELLRWVVSRTLTLEEALEISTPTATCAQLPAPLSSVAAVAAWENEGAWARCQRRVRRALATGEHRRLEGNLPCPTSPLLDSPSVEAAWALLERERAHRLGR